MIVEQDPRKIFRVALDDLTIARLLELADVCHCGPDQVIAAIVKDVLEDDARAHEGQPLTMTVQ